MSQIKRKLQSKRGASLLIALVFLIFAVFIGGSVLAAASANGYRIEHLSDQQDYLNQRSAALLLADEMDIDVFSNISLDAKYATITRQPVILYPDGRIEDNGDAQVSYALTFEANTDGKMDALCRVMFETAVLRYLTLTDTTNVPITFKDFVYDDGSASGEVIDGLEDFWTVNDGSCSGEIKISGIKSGETFTEYTARYTCGGGSQLYDFIVDFGDYSQLTVTMNGFNGVRYQRGAPEYDGDRKVGSNQYSDRVITEVERTAISWNRPVVAKGGAAE